MAIDIEWVRNNPEEAAKQIDLLSDMHVDHVRHLWESRGFGGCVEFAEAFDSLEKTHTALIRAKLEAMPADLKSRFLVIRMVGDINRDEAREIMKRLAKHASGAAIFVNEEVDLEAIDIANRDALKKARQERDVLAAHLAVARQIATDWVENEQTTAATWQLARQIGKWALNDPTASLAEGATQ